MGRIRLPLLVGLAHGVADGAAGWLLGSLYSAGLPLQQIALLVLLYNLLGFGCQPIAGLLIDRIGRPRGATLAGLGLSAVALVVGVAQPALAVTLAGVGSAAFHVGGGALTLREAAGRAGLLGLFAAPGVIGLAVGGLLAVGGMLWASPLLFALLLVCLVLIAIVPVPRVHSSPVQPEPAVAAGVFGHLDGHDLVMSVLLAAIALRSAVWVTLEFVMQHQGAGVLALAIAAATGKLLGGALADWLGWRRYALLALSFAAPLIAFGAGRPWLLLPGIALLQSTTPLGVALLGQHLPRFPATAAGLTFGLAIALGGLPHAIGLSPTLASPLVTAGMILASALALWWGIGRTGNREASARSPQSWAVDDAGLLIARRE